MAKRKCILCGEWIEDNSQSIPYKGKYAHIICFDTAVKVIKKDKDDKLDEKAKGTKKRAKAAPKPKAELKDAVSEEEYAEKKQYYQYLRELINDELSAKVYALTDQYISRYSFTFKEMYQTLVYLHEIIEKDLVGDIVGLIPYYYDQAKSYYRSVEQVAEINKDADLSQMYKEKKIVIQPPKRKIKLLDIESIGKEEKNGS